MSEIEKKIEYPFPRTPHLPGSKGTDDDISLSDSQSAAFLKPSRGQQVIIQEKIDGSNIGVYFTQDGSHVLQGRTHIIRKGDHPQYSIFQDYFWEHYDELNDVLGSEYVLYGELLIATHSVEYDKLPDWIVWFDAMEISSGKFVSHSKLKSMLAGTTLEMAPVHCVKKEDDDDMTIEDMVEKYMGDSSYGDVEAEGIYVRVDEGDYLVSRAKFVRDGFKPGNDKWSRSSIVQKNKLK